ncbi:hypothetical protein KA005_72795 [bacterium]|nr:hypothetical protein [bacterium]
MKLFAIICLFFLFVCLCFCSASAHLVISEQLFISGNGTIDRDLDLQSLPEFAGQKLSETILPIYQKAGGVSTSHFSSDLEFLLYENVSIYYVQDSTLTATRHTLASQNYELGTYTGFTFKGTQMKNISFESSPFLSEAIVSSKAEGRSVLCFRVVNLTNHYIRNVDDTIWMEGEYDIDWNALVINIDYPEEGDDDWLACP